jgi:hypothetical protein
MVENFLQTGFVYIGGAGQGLEAHHRWRISCTFSYYIPVAKLVNETRKIGLLFSIGYGIGETGACRAGK